MLVRYLLIAKLVKQLLHFAWTGLASPEKGGFDGQESICLWPPLIFVAAILLALFPLVGLAANPHLAGDSTPCVWSGKSGATGNGQISSPFSQTGGDPNCSVVDLDWAQFRGSDGQWYWYDGYATSGTVVARIYFCSNPTTGGGTCWWADRAQGRHNAAVIVGGTPIFGTSRLTSATCVGC